MSREKHKEPQQTRLVFMGTPAFAVPALDALSTEGYNIVGVVTQPDRPAGRGSKLTLSPVKETALARGYPLYQPETLRGDGAAPVIAWAPDLIIVAAFGEILRRNILELPPFGCLNIHASLLPKYRGAAPINAAILAGETEAGVTIMRMDRGLDTGDMLAKAGVEIRPDDTTATLTPRLSELGARLMIAVLPGWLSGEITPEAQDHQAATHVGMIKKEAGKIDWTASAEQIERQTRAYDPWPGTYTTFGDIHLKIQRVRVAPPEEGTLKHCPGSVALTAEGYPLITCGEGALILLEVQPAGKKVLDGREFSRGARNLEGSTLGS